MRSFKYDKAVWIMVAVAVIGVLLIMGGCATPQEMAESLRIHVSQSHSEQDFGPREGDSDGYEFGISYAPFKPRPSTVIIVYATHAAAEAGQPPGEVAVPCGGK